MLKIVIDIESSGRTSANVFLVAFGVYDVDTKAFTTKVFNFPEKNRFARSIDTMEWWMSDPDRAQFFEDNELPPDDVKRRDTIKSMRGFIDELYATGKELVFYSDFTVFDHGQVNSMMEEFNLLPLYLKDDKSYPSECVDFTTYVKGLANIPPSGSSNKAFKKLGLERKTLSKNHDPEVDVSLLMDNVLMIENLLIN